MDWKIRKSDTNWAVTIPGDSDEKNVADLPVAKRLASNSTVSGVGHRHSVVAWTSEIGIFGGLCFDRRREGP